MNRVGNMDPLALGELRRRAAEVVELTRYGGSFGGMSASDAKRLKHLETENGKLKNMLADRLLAIDALRRSTQEGGQARPLVGSR